MGRGVTWRRTQIKHRTAWRGPPAEGTMSRFLFDQMVTSRGLRSVSLTSRQRRLLHGLIRSLFNEGGYDIRSLPCPDDGPGRVAYRILGRYGWDGGYESYTEVYARD